MPTLVQIQNAKARKELIKEKLGRVFYRRDLEKLISDLQLKEQFSDSVAKRLISSAHRLRGEWLQWEGAYLYSYEEPTNIFEILATICARKNFYLSHYTAIYLNNLIEQRPREHFVTHEKEGKAVVSPKAPLNPFNVRQAFLKPARTTSNTVYLLDQKISMLEKHWLGEAGVVKKSLTFEDQKLSLKVTGIHRTFLDSVISPHQSGGIGTIVKAFREQQLDPEELFNLYEKLSPIYPYWQCVGFLLQRFGLNKEASSWKRKFSNHSSIPFFLAREAKASWEHSSEWNINYPQGLFHK